MPRTFDPRRVKVNHSYTVWEVAELLGAHRNTVLAWLKSDLPCLRDKRPWLILGRDLRAFLERRRNRHRVRCQPNQLYCIRCKAAREPAGMLLDYEPITDTSGNLKGICSVCELWIYRRASLAKLDLVAGRCTVAFPLGQQRLTERS